MHKTSSDGVVVVEPEKVDLDGALRVAAADVAVGADDCAADCAGCDGTTTTTRVEQQQQQLLCWWAVDHNQQQQQQQHQH